MEHLSGNERSLTQEEGNRCRKFLWLAPPADGRYSSVWLVELRQRRVIYSPTGGRILNKILLVALAAALGLLLVSQLLLPQHQVAPCPCMGTITKIHDIQEAVIRAHLLTRRSLLKLW